MTIGAMNHPQNNIEAEINWIGEQGFDFIDLTLEPPINPFPDPHNIKKLLSKYQLAVVGHTNPNLPAIYPVKEISAAAIVELKRTIDFFQAVGVTKVNIHPFYYPPHQTPEHKIAANIDVLKEINHYCQSLGITLMLENFLPPFDKAPVFQRLLQAVPGLKVHLDIGHCNLTGRLNSTITDFFQQFGDKIIHLHVHDNHGSGDSHLPIGCGNIDWPSTLALIKTKGYDSTITLEVFCRDRQYLLFSQQRLRHIWDQINDCQALI